MDNEKNNKTVTPPPFPLYYCSSPKRDGISSIDNQAWSGARFFYQQMVTSHTGVGNKYNNHLILFQGTKQKPVNTLTYKANNLSFYFSTLNFRKV